MISGKELEDSVRLLYRKFVKGDVIADSTIKASEQAVDAAKNLLAEDDDLMSIGLHGQPQRQQEPGWWRNERCQRSCLPARGGGDDRGDGQRRPNVRSSARRRKPPSSSTAWTPRRERPWSWVGNAAEENSNLLFEVNDMRKALRKSDHKIFERDETIKQLEHRIREMELTAKLAKSGKRPRRS